ncbi:hypothetical protein HYQ46_009729 [Verticillium longisporum]|nr:hypothetical protein HYQ46_009729 [Verticillium longisporum]
MQVVSPTTSISPAASQVQLPLDAADGMDWEEPHPGMRLSYQSKAGLAHKGEAAGTDGYHHVGGCEGGMAAKGQVPESAFGHIRPASHDFGLASDDGTWSESRRDTQGELFLDGNIEHGHVGMPHVRQRC